MDTEILSKIIIGRVEPHIYAFTTNTIPDYLKIGDTFRPVSERLREWKRIFPTLEGKFKEKAKIEESYFRDFSVHSFLENDKGKSRLQKNDLPNGVYYSKEFFKDTTCEDVKSAIEAIKNDYKNKTQRFQFYSINDLQPESLVYARNQNFDLRDNQKEVVENFVQAINKGRRNLLMYAVMRFGKSFTAMNCALKMDAKLVVVVSAKATVLDEWKQTVESHKAFAEYVFITAKKLDSNNQFITETIASGKKAVVFLTLQDLTGQTIKDRHREVFGEKIDLLLVDETHFGARAEKYGEVLKNASNYVPDKAKDKTEDESFDADQAEKIVKTLKAEVTIHLSGTPYRILHGSEFKKEDIIAFCQFSDIVDLQKKWDEQHLLDDDVKEWDNPYFGFPQMVRFAFNPNESSRRRLAELKNNGTTYAFSALFKPKSIAKKRDGSHKKFVYEQEILELLEVIDGSKTDDNLLSFLDYDKIKEGKMCRHIVMVLPYRASCDAMEELIKNNHNKFKNLKDFEILNIAGVEDPEKYESIATIKQQIKTFESEGKKTLTLTVNRMLTGSTVPEWDTMLFLKDTASPQEYDQAIFRLQNQYVKTCTDEKGDVLKINMKPQTLLVDFDPSRLFALQESRAKIYNVNTEENGNSKLKERIEKELAISPVVTINCNKIEQVKAADILQIIVDSQKNKGIREEALETPVDLEILKDDVLRAAIAKENEIGSNAGISTPAHTSEDGGEGSELVVPDTQPSANDENDDTNEEEDDTTTKQKEKEKNSWIKKIQSFYVRIFLFAFLTKDTVISVSDIISKIDSDENKRIAKNLGLYKTVLKSLHEKTNGFTLSDIDYRIQYLNSLQRQENQSTEEKVAIAVKKFGKLGEAAVITPSNICDDMVNLLPNEFLKSVAEENGKLLDIAGTAGEFAIALHKKMKSLGIADEKIADSICTIPKSGMCFELVKKVYEMLGLNLRNISTFCATDLLEIKNRNEIDYAKISGILTQNKPFDQIKLTDTVQEDAQKVKFDAIVGNPPYQEENGSTRKPPIYHLFYDMAFRLAPIVSLITPARFLFEAGQTPQNWNKKMLNDEHFKVIKYFSHTKDVFDTVDIKGGIVITLRNSNEFYGKLLTFTSYEELNSIVDKVKNCKSFCSIKGLVSSQGIYRFSDKFFNEHPEIYKITGKGTGAKIISRIVDLMPQVFVENPVNTKCVKILSKSRSSRLVRYIFRDYLQNNEYIDTYNVSLPESNGAGAFDQFSSPVITIPGVGVTDTFISIGTFNNLIEAENLLKYIKSKFLRALLGVKKATQHNPKDTWDFVPIQNFTEYSDIDWSKSVAEIDRQLYKKYDLSEEEIAFIESKIKPME